MSVSYSVSYRSVIPLDVPGCTTLIEPVSLLPVASMGNLVKLTRDCNISSKYKLSAYVDYIPDIPAVCTHCQSLLLIEWLSEIFGLECLLCLNWIGVALDNLDFKLVRQLLT